MDILYWNIFARELQFILRGHGLELGDLTLHVGIHQYKVRRLLQSLHAPIYGLPVLDAEEVKRVGDVLSLNEEEHIRLQAALLTGITQRTLYQHIRYQDMLLAADQIFLVTLRSLTAQAQREKEGNGRGSDFGGSEDTALDKALALALEAFDSGIEDLQMCDTINSRSKKRKLLLHAEDSFKNAIDMLRLLSPGIQWQPGWQYWHSEALKELAHTKSLLEGLNQDE